jgi:tetratricopeptide (TPR) repeat protein
MHLSAQRSVRLAAITFACAALVCCSTMASHAADNPSVSNLLSQAQAAENAGDTPGALKACLAADHLAPDNADILCRLAQQYCDSISAAPSTAAKKKLAEQALDCGFRAVKAAPQSAKAHVTVAVCYAKNFPYIDNQTRVNYSRQIKAESEKAIALDPKFDLAYHMLGRWEFEVSNMNFFIRGLVSVVYGGLPKASKQLAIEDFKKAVELAPGRIINYLQLARMYHVTGQESLVHPELEKCATLKPLDHDDQSAQKLALNILRGEKWPENF